MPARPDPKPDQSGQDFLHRHGKRLLIHGLGLTAALAVTMSLPGEGNGPARQAALFLCTYAGILNLLPLDFTFSGLHIIPIAAGLGPAIAFVVLGAPWPLLPLWMGITATICRLAHKRGQLSDIATLLPITTLAMIAFGLDLAALSPVGLPWWMAIFGLAAWLGSRSMRSLEKYLLLAENPVFKDKAKRRRIMDYSTTVNALEGKITETPQDMHIHIGGISDSARAIIDLMVTDPRTFAQADLFLARYLAPALRLIEDHMTLTADYAGHDTTAPNHPLARSLETITRLDNAFKQQLIAMRTNKTLDFNADLAVLDKLLKMDDH